MAPDSVKTVRPDSGVLAAFLIIATILLAAMALGVASGVTDITFTTVWKVVLSKVIPDAVTIDWTRAHERIIWDLRLPRAFLAALTGAGLALSGAALQATTRNPLADPFLLGVSSGAALGAVAVISPPRSVRRSLQFADRGFCWWRSIPVAFDRCPWARGSRALGPCDPGGRGYFLPPYGGNQPS